MKYLKMLTVAAVAAVAAMAFIGAGTASATVCSKNQLPCTSPFTGPVKAELTEGHKAVLTSGFAVIECEQSVIAGEIEKNEGAVSTGKIKEASWSKCMCNLGGTVTTGALGLPWSATVTYTKEMDGTMAVSNAGGWFTCAGTKCEYTTATATTEAKGGAPAHVIATEVKLKKSGGGFLCSENATWSGNYTITSPSELWVSAS